MTVSNTQGTHSTHHTTHTAYPTPPHSAAFRQGRFLLFSSSLPTKTPGTVYSTYREPHEGGDTDEAYKPTVVNALPAGGKGKVGGRMKEEGRKEGYKKGESKKGKYMRRYE